MIEVTTTMTLSDPGLRQTTRAKVLAVSADDDLSVRLMEMGLTPGVVFQIVKIAPLGDPIEIELRGYRLCLRKREASGIEIEILP